jgi:hypothetical protein
VRKGGIAGIAGVWSLFLDWLNLLGALVTPIGAVMIRDRLVVRHNSSIEKLPSFGRTAFAAWTFAATVAIVVHYMALSYSEAVAGLFAGACELLRPVNCFSLETKGASDLRVHRLAHGLGTMTMNFGQNGTFPM